MNLPPPLPTCPNCKVPLLTHCYFALVAGHPCPFCGWHMHFCDLCEGTPWQHAVHGWWHTRYFCKHGQRYRCWKARWLLPFIHVRIWITLRLNLRRVKKEQVKAQSAKGKS